MLTTSVRHWELLCFLCTFVHQANAHVVTESVKFNWNLNYRFDFIPFNFPYCLFYTVNASKKQHTVNKTQTTVTCPEIILRNISVNWDTLKRKYGLVFSQNKGNLNISLCILKSDTLNQRELNTLCEWDKSRSWLTPTLISFKASSVFSYNYVLMSLKNAAVSQRVFCMKIRALKLPNFGNFPIGSVILFLSTEL